jgi:hypothetical protein
MITRRQATVETVTALLQKPSMRQRILRLFSGHHACNPDRIRAWTAELATEILGAKPGQPIERPQKTVALQIRKCRIAETGLN